MRMTSVFFFIISRKNKENEILSHMTCVLTFPWSEIRDFKSVTDHSHLVCAEWKIEYHLFYSNKNNFNIKFKFEYFQ